MRGESRPVPESVAGTISRYPADALKDFMVRVMVTLGANESDAQATAKIGRAHV